MVWSCSVTVIGQAVGTVYRTFAAIELDNMEFGSTVAVLKPVFVLVCSRKK